MNTSGDPRSKIQSQAADGGLEDIMRKTLIGLLALWGWMAAAANAGWWIGSDDRAQVVRAIARVYPALVRVEVVSEEASGGRMEKARGSGSGTIISREGHVLTNHHVAGKATRLICRLADGREIPARLVGTDALSDIAVLQLDLTDTNVEILLTLFADDLSNTLTVVSECRLENTVSSHKSSITTTHKPVCCQD